MMTLTVDQDVDFLKEILDDIIDERTYDLPTEYIERIRYIPNGLSPKPGYFEFSFTPYWIEVFNCLAGDSGIQVLAIMKAAQIGYTVAILENAILYFMGSNPKYVQFITADNKLIEETVKERINPMIKHAGLEHLIFAQAKAKGSRATGNTLTHKEYPGGAINFTGANNPDAFRGRTKQVTLGDEVDTFKDDKREGSKIGLITNRSNAFSATRKMVWGSTPLITQTSVIYNLYLQGDQRHYNIICPRCHEPIVLKWHGVRDDGFKYGIDFEHEKGIPIYETVHYKCQICKGEFYDYDKSSFILDGSGFWVPTAKTQDPEMRSYWLSALYSPPGVYPWEKIVKDWILGWDLEANRVKNMEKYREFRNTKQGLPFEEKGESISYTKSVIHRRPYPRGILQNELIEKDTGGIALIVLCSVDCQKNNLFVDVKAYTSGARVYTIDFLSFEGETEDLNSPSWEMLYDFILNQIYVDEVGRQYRIINTFIDSGKYTTYVTEFCKQFSEGVYPIKGERTINGRLPLKLMSKPIIEKYGVDAFLINTTLFKDQIAYSFNKNIWKEREFQPPGYYNFPEDFRDDYFKQFSAESKVEARDPRTNVYLYSYWRQASSSSDNHSFDTFVYNLANLYFTAEDYSVNVLGFPAISWTEFWEEAEAGIFYIDQQDRGE